MKVPGRDTVDGIDVSRWQGGVDWNAFNLDFAIIKSSGGDGGLYVDPQFHANARWPRPWAPYHFAGGTNALAEARYFCDAIRGTGWTLRPVLDWEVNWPAGRAREATAWVHTFQREVERQFGVVPVLYTGAYVCLDRSDASLTRYPLWLAAYTGQPISCAPWGNRWTAWQYSSTGHVPGIVGNVDMNIADRSWFLSQGVTPSGLSLPESVPAPAPSSKDVPMFLIRDPRDGGIWLCSALHKRHLGDPNYVSFIQGCPDMVKDLGDADGPHLGLLDQLIEV